METYRLLCHQDPRALGIERSDGAWDLTVFDLHRVHCAPCRSFQHRLTEEVQVALDQAMDTGQAVAATPQVNASAELIIREVIDVLNNTRHTFKSKQIERARQLLASVLTSKESRPRSE